MRAVGIRDFKEHLSQHLRAVRSGEVILVTDRGEVVAEVRPPTRPREHPYPALFELAERGLVELGAPNAEADYSDVGPPLPAGLAQRLLDEERGDR